MKKYGQILSVYFVIFLHMLDTTVANMLLLRISPDLGVDIQEGSWIITVFGTGILISFGLSGLIGKRYGIRSTFFWANVFFALTSIACGLTHQFYLFFIARLLQGFASGLVMNVSYPILLSIFKGKNPARATAAWVSAISIAPVIGPIYGAFITEFGGWEWVFLINAPLICLSLLPFIFDHKVVSSQETTNPTLLLALISYAVAAACFQFTIDLGTQNNWIFSVPLVSLTAACVLASILFFKLNALSGRQVLEIDLLKNRRFSTYLVIMGVGTGIIFSSMLLLPIWLQNDYGLSIIYSGLIVAVSSLTAAVLSPIIGKWVLPARMGLCAMISLVFVFFSFATTSFHQLDTAISSILIGRFLLGCGLSLFSTSLTTLMMGSGIAPEKMLAANTFNMISRVFASNLFATGTIYYYKIMNQKNYGDYQATSISARWPKNDLEANIAFDYLSKIIHTLSFNQIFKFLTIFSLAILILLVMLFRKPVRY